MQSSSETIAAPPSRIRNSRFTVTSYRRHRLHVHYGTIEKIIVPGTIYLSQGRFIFQTLLGSKPKKRIGEKKSAGTPGRIRNTTTSIDLANSQSAKATSNWF